MTIINDNFNAVSYLVSSLLFEILPELEKHIGLILLNAAGMIPDVGASYFLPRLANSSPHLGLYIALINGRLKGVDLRHTQIATHYIQSNYVCHCYLMKPQR